MTTNSKAATILKDLWAIRTWSNNHNNQPPPPPAVAYVDANSKLLDCLIDLVSKTPHADRRLLWSQHRELDESVTSSTYDFSISHTSVETARQVIAGNGLAKFSDDDVNMIIRSVEYTKYLDSEDCDDPIVRSPIQLPK